jgi:hypothetical protein
MIKGLLFEKLRPSTRIWVVFGTDPSVGEHQLEHEDDQGCSEAHTRKDVDDAFVGAFLFFLFDSESRGL